MADAATHNPVLGYSLHQKTTQLIEDFIKNVLDNDFQYLDEILAEVKEHFGRRDSVALLPKTPCMKKGKRKRVVRSLDDSIESHSNTTPEKGQSKVKADSFGTPDSKKPAISHVTAQSPTEVPDTKQANGNGRLTRARASKNKKFHEDLEVSIQEKEKTRTKGSRKQSKGSKRQVRGGKNSSKQVTTRDEVDETAEKEAIPKGPRTRNKRKQDETEVPVTPVKMSSIQDDSEKHSLLQWVAKKSKLSVSPAKYKETPLAVEVFIPETPIVESLSKGMCDEKPQAAKSSLQVVLTPTSVAEPHYEIESGFTEGEKENVITNPVVIVEAITYENQEQVNKTPEQEHQEQVISESTVSSTKKISNKKTKSRSSRASSSRGNKRKQDDDKEVVQDSSVISSFSTNNEVEIEENVPKIQKVEQSDSDAVVSSTVNLPDESQRKSIRLSRSTRKSSRLSVQATKKQRKSKTRKSRSLVKSSVMLKLSSKKIMPRLTPKKYDDAVADDAESLSNSNELNNVKANLFEDEEDNDKEEMEPVPEICEAHSSTPVKTTDKDSTEENDDIDEAEDEEFHDAAENIDEEINDGDYHDVPETTEEADDQKDVISRPATHLSSRNQNRDSQSSDDGDQSLSSESGSNLSQCSENEAESKGHQSSKDTNPFNIGPPKVIKNPAGVIHSFIKRNTPKKVDSKEKSRMMKMAILEKQEKEKERIEQLELLKQKRIEDQKRKRQEKERKAAELRAAKAREEQERREQMEKKLGMRKQLEEKARKEKEKEEEMKRKARLQKKAELDARRKQEEEQRKQKIQEKEDEARRHQDMLRRKAEFEEQERQRKIMEAKRQQELREQELEREREQEKLRLLREIEEKERKAKEEKEKAERKLREEKEKEEKERKRIAQLLREKEESERKEREKKAKEEKWRQEREAAYREELEKERQRQRKLEEQRIAEEARLKPLQDKDSYEMTPPPPPKIRSVTSSENYNIDDICSDDSTDDEDAPKKRIPSWAQGAKLKAALINQAMGKFDIEAIFGGVEMPNLDEIFTYKKKKRFYQRTSSAHWDSPPLRTLNRGSTLI